MENNYLILDLQRIFRINNFTKKLLCKVNVSNFSDEDIAQAIYKKFNSKARVIKATIKKVNDEFITCIVTATKRIYNKTNYRQIKANIVQDLNDNTIWKVVSINGEKQLILLEDKDYDKIFKESAKIKTFAASYTTIEPEINDYVSFYSISQDKMLTGIVASKALDNYIVVSKDLNTYKVSPFVIVDIIKIPTEATLTNKDADNILDYYAKLYKNTELFKKLDQLINKRPANRDSDTMVVQSAVGEFDFSDVKNQIKELLVNMSVEELENEIKNNQPVDTVIDAPSVIEENKEDTPKSVNDTQKEEVVVETPKEEVKDVATPEDKKVTPEDEALIDEIINEEVTDEEPQDNEEKDNKINTMTDEELIDELTKEYSDENK